MQGKKKSAIKKFTAAVKANPKNAAAYLSLGTLYEQSKAYSKAIQVYQDALNNNPKFWFAANNLAFLLAEKATSAAELEKALEMALQAQKYRPGSAEVLDTLGWIYYKKGDINNAHGFNGKAIEFDPDNAILNYHMGMVFYKSGNNDQAREKLEKALADKKPFLGRQEAKKTLSLLK